MRYIALLRGVNVGGHQVKMDYLRALFSELGLGSVRTYIQSGNVFFDTDARDRTTLTSTIEAHLLARLGFAVPTYLRTVEEVEATLALDPFKDVTVTDDMRLNVVFASRPIPPTLETPLWSAKRNVQIARVTPLDAFVVWYLIGGRPPSNGTFLEKALGGPVTSRFLHTTAKILEAAKAG
ncbi:MAG TPA: DUF1697 domain-containing protein [Ktedonobacterales bacterium]